MLELVAYAGYSRGSCSMSQRCLHELDRTRKFDRRCIHNRAARTSQS